MNKSSQIFSKCVVAFMIVSFVGCAQSPSQTRDQNESEALSADGSPGNYQTTIDNPRNFPCDLYTYLSTSGEPTYQKGSDPNCMILARKFGNSGAIVGYERYQLVNGQWLLEVKEGAPVKP
jgi:hypothetical protein